MKKLKSLTIAIPDIVAIFAITDPAVREQAVSILEKEAADPENADPERYADADPVIYRLVSIIRDRVAKSHRCAEARARRKAEQEEAKKAAEAKAETEHAKPQSESARQLHEAAETAVARLTDKKPDLVDLSVFKCPDRVTVNIAAAHAVKWMQDNMGTSFYYIKQAFRRASACTPMQLEITKSIDRIFNALARYMQVHIKAYTSRNW